jgi:hypothetical protein
MRKPLPSRKRQPAPKKQMGAVRAVLSIPSLQELMRGAVLRGNQKVPSEDFLQVLASELRLLRILSSARDYIGQEHKLFDEWLTILSHSLEVTQKIRERFNLYLAVERGDLKTRLLAYPEFTTNDDIAERKSEIARIEMEQALIAKLQTTTETILKWRHSRPNGDQYVIRSWHDIAHRLVLAFVSAMRSTNAGFKLGLSNEGPCQRFVAAVVPHVTGELPSVQAVGKWLKDNPPAGTPVPANAV